MGKYLGRLSKISDWSKKSWLPTTTKQLRNFKEPVIVLTVDGNENDVEAKGKVLDQFVESFGTSPGLQESFIPVKFDFQLDFFPEINYYSFSVCLTRLGNDLMEVELEYPCDREPFQLHFHPSVYPSYGNCRLNFQMSSWMVMMFLAITKMDLSCSS